jgi:hypothetical protein
MRSAPLRCDDVETGRMSNRITPIWPVALTLAAVGGVLGACSSRASGERTANGTLDSTALERTTIATTAGPSVRVTRSDGRSVARAAQYQLTRETFAAFRAAAESLAALERRDPHVRDYLDVNVSDAGSPDADAGRKWLESNDKVSHAIAASGISVPEYYVASIAIASAERFLNTPWGASPPLALAKNARFLQAHRGDLARLHLLRERRAEVPR